MEFHPGSTEVESGVATGSLPQERCWCFRLVFGVWWLKWVGSIEVGGGELEADAYEIIGVPGFGVFVFKKIIHYVMVVER